MRSVVIDVSTLINGINTGTSKYSYYLAKKLSEEKNIKLALFAFCPIKFVSILKTFLKREFSNLKIVIIPLPSCYFSSFLSIWQKINYPAFDYFFPEAEIFHSMGWFFPPLNKIYGIGTIFDLIPLTNPLWSTKENNTQHLKRIESIQRSSSYIITISKSIQKQIYKILKPEVPVEVIYPGVNHTIYFRRRSSSIRKHLKSFQVNPNYILFVGDLNIRKNVKRMITSFLQSILVTKSKDIPQLLIISNFPPDNNISKLIRKHTDSIKIINRASEEELSLFYCGARFLLFPSLFEGFGMPILESMACGTPVVTSKNAGGIKEAAGEAALMINPKSINEITAAIIKVNSSDSFRQKLIKKGAKQAKKFSWEISCKQLLNVYKMSEC